MYFNTFGANAVASLLCILRLWLFRLEYQANVTHATNSGVAKERNCHSVHSSPFTNAHVYFYVQTGTIFIRLRTYAPWRPFYLAPKCVWKRFWLTQRTMGRVSRQNKESPLRSSSRCLARFENSFPRFPFDSQCSWVQETVCNYLLTAIFIDIVKVWS